MKRQIPRKTRPARHLYPPPPPQAKPRPERLKLPPRIDVSGVALPDGFKGARDVMIIFHGRGGPDRETVPARLTRQCDSQREKHF